MPLIPVLTTDVDGVSKYATANGMAFRDAIDAEQLLKAADDLDNSSYWDVDGVTPTEPSSGVWRLTKTAAADKYISQTLTNWYPAWAGTSSIYVTVTSDDLTAGSIVVLVDGSDAVASAEVVSGNAGVAVASSIANVTGIDGADSVIRVQFDATAWAASIVVRYYPDKANTTAGYIDTSLSQIVLGSTAKPRPTQTDPDDWMMAYRPHNRVTADGAARYSVTDSEGLVWCGEATDTAAAPTSGSWSVIHLAGGVTVPAYGDPGIWLTEPDGSAFSVGASDAVMFTVKTFEAAKLARFGFDDGTTGATKTPTAELSSNALYVTSAAQETPQTWTAGTTKSFIQLLRSDTHGSQFLLHDSGKEWDRINVNADAIPAASAYPAISNYNAAISISNFALLDLSSMHSEEWCGQIDAKSAPANNDTFITESSCHFNATFTPEAAQPDVSFSIPYAWGTPDAGHNGLKITFDTSSGWLGLSDQGDGGSTSLYAAGGIVSDGVAIEVDFIYDEATKTYSLFIDKALKSSGSWTRYAGGLTTGMVEHTLATNDIEIDIRGVSLGGTLGATDRQVAPQASDTGTADADCLAILRATQVPSAGNLQVELRKSGSDEITYDVDSNGKPILYDNANPDIEGSNGDVSSDDDNMIVLDGTDSEIFTNGATDGSTAALSVTSGVTWNIASLGTAGAADALELWSGSASILNPAK